jgi:hypothetical protein
VCVEGITYTPGSFCFLRRLYSASKEYSKKKGPYEWFPRGVHVRLSIIFAERDIYKYKYLWCICKFDHNVSFIILCAYVCIYTNFTCVSISGSAGNIFLIEPRLRSPPEARRNVGVNGFGELDIVFLWMIGELEGELLVKDDGGV